MINTIWKKHVLNGCILSYDLLNIKSPQIRSIVAKYRLDIHVYVNNTLILKMPKLRETEDMVNATKAMCNCITPIYIITDKEVNV